jgi:hypothetical protein
MAAAHQASSDLEHSYRVRFPDGVEESLKPDQLVMLAKFKEGEKRFLTCCYASSTLSATAATAVVSSSAPCNHPTHFGLCTQESRR